MKLDWVTWLTGCGCHCVTFCGRLGAETGEALWNLSWSSHQVTLHWCQHEATFQTSILLTLFDWKRGFLFCFVFSLTFFFRCNPPIWSPVEATMHMIKLMTALAFAVSTVPFFRVILISPVYHLIANIVFPVVLSWPVFVHSKFYACPTPMDSFSDPHFCCSVRLSNIENNVDHKSVYYRPKSQIF